MNAAGYEQAIDPETMGAGEIGAHGIADRQNPFELNRPTSPLSGKLDRALIDRPVRLAIENHLAAELAIELGDGAGTIDQPVAALDDNVGIGADQRQLALAGLHHHAAIIFRRLGLVVEQPGANDVIGLLQRREHRIEAAMDRAVALGAEPEYL